MNTTNTLPTNADSFRDVFISYTRKDGATAASLLYQVLKAKKIDAFLDSEKLTKGDYLSGINAALKNVKNFILIVSEHVFNSENVCEEIKLAKENKIHIIPIFVNGITNYPNNIPEKLDFLKTVNGYKLNHENFDAQLLKIISELETRHLKFLTALIAHYEDVEQKNEGFEALCEAWKEIVGEENALNYLTTSLKNEMQKAVGLEKDDVFLHVLMETVDTKGIKEVAKKMDLNHFGGYKKICLEINNFIKTGAKLTHSSDVDGDRYETLFHCLAAVYRDKENIVRLKEICENNNIEVYSKRSSEDLLEGVFDECQTVEEVFNLLDETAEETKTLAFALFNLKKRPTAKKEELQILIGKWVNYEYTPDPSECE